MFKKFFVLSLLFFSVSVFSIQQTDVFLTLTKKPELKKNLPTNAVILTEQEIKDIKARNLSEAIKFTEGIIETSNRGSIGSESNIRIRNGGASASQVLVMVDGISVNSTSIGSTNLSEISIDDVERVEIIRGPFSALYGANALGGVVNIITKKEVEKTEGKISLAGGSFSEQNYGIKFGTRKQNLSTYLTLSRIASDGYRKNSECDNNNISIHSTYDITDKSKINFDGRYTKLITGVPGSLKYWDYFNLKWVSYSDDEKFSSSPHAQQGNEKIYTSLGYSSKIYNNSNLKFRIYGLRDNGSYFDPDTHPELWIFSKQDKSSRNITFGTDFQYDTVYDITFGGDIHQDEFQQEDKVDPTKNIDKKTTNSSVFIQKIFYLSDLKTIAGFRYDHNSVYGGEFNPRLTLIYWLRKNLKLSGNAGSAFRAPTFDDLYWPDPWTPGNPDLKPEKSWAFDLGLEYSPIEILTGKITIFRSDVSNFIQWAPKPDNPNIWTPLNVAKTYSQGVELELKHSIIKNILKQKMNCVFLESKGKIEDEALNSSLKISGKRGGENFGTLLYTPNYRINYQIEHLTNFGLKSNLYFEYVPERYNLDEWNFDGYQEVKIPPYKTLNLTISYRISNIEFFSAIENITEEKYEIRYGYPMPGRIIRIGMDYTF